MVGFPLGLLSQGGGAGSGADYELISTTILGSAAASVQFSAIPQTYKHLQIRFTARSSIASNVDNLAYYFNTDTAANYSTHSTYYLSTGASAPGSNAFTSNGSMYLPSQLVANSNPANVFSSGIMEILDYTNTTTNKTTRTFTGFAHNGSSYYLISLVSGNWRSTTAINQITFSTSANLMAGSRFSLYGLRG